MVGAQASSGLEKILKPDATAPTASECMDTWVSVGARITNPHIKENYHVRKSAT